VPMTDVRFCKVQLEKPRLAPERRSREGPIRPRERPSARDDHPTSRASRALLARPGAIRRGAGGDRRGQRRTAGGLDLLPAWVGYSRLTRRTLGRGPPAIGPGTPIIPP